MSPKEKAEYLVNKFRIILMSEDTECGNEILCTEIAKRCALVCTEEVKNLLKDDLYQDIKVKWQKLFYKEMEENIKSI